MKFDVIIIGAGVAGLQVANNLSDDKNILIICKDRSWECNTFYAQGGIAVAVDEEDIALHIEDTLKAGSGLCDKEAVELMCKNGPMVVNELIEDGFNVDRGASGELLFTKEAAHSRARVVHAGGDATGRELHLHLMKKNRASILYQSIVTDLLIKDGYCYGVELFSGQMVKRVYCDTLVIASGGVGSLYEYHTNAKSISADLQGIILEKGGKLQDMEMLQFHPTVFVHSRGARKQLLTEALRGEGAYIEDEDGKRFLFEYDERGELSPRSTVSQAIIDWKAKSGKEVYLSFENFTKEGFKNRFPTIYQHLKDVGYTLPRDRVPISPAFHYAMGGIKSDLSGKVEGFENIYAVGEVASIRVHGANRLASNSLLEGLVFGKIVAQNVKKEHKKLKEIEFEKSKTNLKLNGDKELKNELRDIMWGSAGVIRSKSKLKEALKRVNYMLELDIGRLLYLRLLVSKQIIKSALENEKSLGAHILID